MLVEEKASRCTHIDDTIFLSFSEDAAKVAANDYAASIERVGLRVGEMTAGDHIE